MYYSARTKHGCPVPSVSLWPGLRFAAIGFAAIALCIAAFAGAPVQGGPLPSPLFPPDNWWNLDISAAPVDPNSVVLHQFHKQRLGEANASRLRR